jgi:hypothetical protein
MQTRVDLLMAASDAFDERSGVDEEKRELLARSEVFSAIVMRVDALIESVHGLEKQKQLLIAVDRLVWAVRALFDIPAFTEAAQNRRRPVRAREGVRDRKVRKQALLLPLIRNALEENLKRKILLDAANARLADRGEKTISRATLDAWIREIFGD